MKTINLPQFNAFAAAQAADRDRRAFVRQSLNGYAEVRRGTESRFADHEAARTLASHIKWHAVEHLDEHLSQFASKLEARGATVFWAEDAHAAQDYILGLLNKLHAKVIVKSKTMTSEEIHLNELLERKGFEVIESDLGDFIVQLRRESASHFVFPAMHLRRDEIGRTFEDRLGERAGTDPEALTMVARRVLREKFLQADVGITGANFAIAETGMISITENEGNARLTFSLPRVHIAIVGVEKVLPRVSDLALFLPMLAAAGTGQHLTGYNSLIAGPRRPGETDGPEQMHVILLDNGRTNLLADPVERDALRCIRCGACLNVCPVFRTVGGHAYGSTYQGPIGSVITPHMRNMQEWRHLAHASSLCGACTATCPIRIDLHHHLLRTRALGAAHAGFRERLGMKLFTLVMTRPRLYRIASRLARIGHVLGKPLRGTRFDPLRAWRVTRDFPDPAKETFRAMWGKRG